MIDGIIPIARFSRQKKPKPLQDTSIDEFQKEEYFYFWITNQKIEVLPK